MFRSSSAAFERLNGSAYQRRVARLCQEYLDDKPTGTHKQVRLALVSSHKLLQRRTVVADQPARGPCGDCHFADVQVAARVEPNVVRGDEVAGCVLDGYAAGEGDESAVGDFDVVEGAAGLQPVDRGSGTVWSAAEHSGG